MKKLETIYLLYNYEGILEGFALTTKEANERGYISTDPFADVDYYEELSRVR